MQNHYSKLQMSVQPIGPVEGGSPGTYKIPVQKIDYVSAAWGGVCVQGEWISATMRQSMTPRIYHKRYSHTIQSRGLRFFFFFNRLLDSESGSFLARQPPGRPDIQQKNSRLVQKGFLYKGSPFVLLKWDFFFLISKNVRVPSFEAKQ